MRLGLLIICLLSAVVFAGAQTVIFDSDMSTGESSNFTAVQSPDTTYQFGYDWSSDALDATTGYTTVPAAPNGDTVGLKITLNNVQDATDYEEALTIFANTLCPEDGYYDVEFDWFIAYTLPLIGGGPGSTEHIGIVVQSAGSTICTIRDATLDAVNPGTPGASGSDYLLQDGIGFGTTGDAGELVSDLFCFMPSARTTAGNQSRFEAQVGTWQGANPLPPDDTAVPAIGKVWGEDADDGPYFYAALSFPAIRVTDGSDYTPGYLWNTYKAEVRGSQVTFYVNDVPFVIVNSTLTDRSAGIIGTDPFASFSNPPDQSYILIDGFKITDQPVPLAVKDWALYE